MQHRHPIAKRHHAGLHHRAAPGAAQAHSVLLAHSSQPTLLTLSLQTPRIQVVPCCLMCMGPQQNACQLKLPWSHRGRCCFPFASYAHFTTAAFSINCWMMIDDPPSPPLVILFPTSPSTALVWCAMPQEIALHVVMIYIGNFVAAFTYNCQEVVGSRGNMAGKYRAQPALPGRAEAKRPIIYTANRFFIHTTCSILATCQICTLSSIFDLFLLQ